MREKVAEEFQTPAQSHQEWKVESEFTSTTLDQRYKEPRELLFLKVKFSNSPTILMVTSLNHNLD